MLLTVSLLFLSEVIRLLYAEKETTLLGQTGSTSLPNKIVRDLLHILTEPAIYKTSKLIFRKLKIIMYLSRF